MHSIYGEQILQANWLGGSYEKVDGKLIIPLESGESLTLLITKVSTVLSIAQIHKIGSLCSFAHLCILDACVFFFYVAYNSPQKKAKFLC
jgi:hypothetical protein